MGKQMEFFGGGGKVGKGLVYRMNGGMEEKVKMEVGGGRGLMVDEVVD